MTKGDIELNRWLSVIKAEYKEMPGQQLTKPQFLRLWGLEAAVCDAVIETLQATDFLQVTPGGSYTLADAAVETRSQWRRQSRQTAAPACD